MADQYELPKAVVKRIIKEKLHTTNAAGQKKNVVLHKDVLLAVTESAKVFLNYLTSTANDICQGNKRQTISANDVLEALEDLAFTELVEPLKEALAVYKQQTQEKNKQKAEAAKKRKSDAAAEAAAAAAAAAGADTEAGAAADAGTAGEQAEDPTAAAAEGAEDGDADAAAADDQEVLPEAADEQELPEGGEEQQDEEEAAPSEGGGDMEMQDAEADADS